MLHGKQGSGGGFSGPLPPHGLSPTLHPKATKTPSYTKWFSYQPGETVARALGSQEPVSPGAVIAEAKKNTHEPEQNGGGDSLDCGCTIPPGKDAAGRVVPILAEEMSAELAKPAALRFNHPKAVHLVLPEGGLLPGARLRVYEPWGAADSGFARVMQTQYADLAEVGFSPEPSRRSVVYNTPGELLQTLWAEEYTYSSANGIKRVEVHKTAAGTWGTQLTVTETYEGTVESTFACGLVRMTQAADGVQDNGRSMNQALNCEGNLMWRIDEDGIRTDYACDSARQLIETTRSEVSYEGMVITRETITEYERAAAGRILTTTTRTGAMTTVTRTAYDLVGREVSQTDILGLVCYNYRHYNPLDGRWTGRDPEESGQVNNSYDFATNQPNRVYDLQGKKPGGLSVAVGKIVKEISNAVGSDISSVYLGRHCDPRGAIMVPIPFAVGCTRVCKSFKWYGCCLNRSGGGLRVAHNQRTFAQM